MSKAAVPTAKTAEAEGSSKKGGGKKKLLLLLLPAALAAIGAGLWFGGILPPLLGMGPAKVVAHGQSAPEAAPEVPKAKALVFMDMPEIVANLNSGSVRRNVFVKLHAKLELAKIEDQPGVTAAMPRLQDLFQTYLREMRPEELRGSAGSYRLREELIARANIAAAPARVLDVLFTEILIQ